MRSPAQAALQNFADPSHWTAVDQDPPFFATHLRSFVPEKHFDAHAHWYDLRHILPGGKFSEPHVGHAAMSKRMQEWMGDRAAAGGLYFGFPTRNVDCNLANRFLEHELATHPECRGLMLIRPHDNPADVETQLINSGFAGFKVYHVFADREDSFYCEQDEFLPDWAWEIAHRHGLWITMHMVLPNALSDERNWRYIQRQCLQWPNARLVLAHAARGFNASHTIQAIEHLRGIENVFFDTSAICEPGAFEAIIKTTGVTRLMYGSDFPVSEQRGKAISVGSGFMWLYEHNVQWEDWPHGQPALVGIESLLALQQACRTMCLKDGDIERIFRTNATDLLGITRPVPEKLKVQYAKAKTSIPGGTQLLSKRPEMFAPGHWPGYYEQAIGCETVDTSGRRFTDMSSNGILACLLGFADPDVNAAVIRRVHLGSMSTQQTYDEVELAEELTRLHPWADRARFARTGGEAAAIAVRIARASTGRDKVAICGYHGWHDWYLAANLGDASGLDGHLLPGLAPDGVPKALTGTTLPFHYNDEEGLKEIVEKHGEELAAIVMEPIRSVQPIPGFLASVREAATACGARLIFDEISSGWRMCVGGAHLLFGVAPDLAIFAKTISNGFAMSAVIGREPTMIAAEHSFISSAYWTEGVGPAAALAAVKKMQQVDVCSHVAAIGRLARNGWTDLGRQSGLPLQAAGRDDAVQFGIEHPSSNALMTLFTTRMLDHGFLAAGGFSPTWAHTEYHVDRFLDAAKDVCVELKDAIQKQDVDERIDHRPKHTMFTRLAD